MERLPTSNAGDDEMKTTMELAREAGFETMLRKGKILGFDRDGDYTEELKAFEALVRADESARAAVPDKITDNSESPEYIQGWNDCRAEMLGGQL
jgi:hypothetical protein